VGVGVRKVTARSLLSLVTAALVLSGCGGRGVQRRAAPTTSVVSATSSTSTSVPVMSPLTGLPQPDAKRAMRVALVVKIDNEWGAQPQAGLNQADVVFEEQVEGGDSRLAAVFQSADADLVGPIRSTRSTDVAIVSQLNHPLYAFSGGNRIFLAQIRAAPIVDVGADVQPGVYFRVATHRVPHNLFSRTAALFLLAPPGAGPPAPLFIFGAAAVPVRAASAAVHRVDFRFGLGGTAAAWAWDPSGGVWERDQNGSAQLDSSGAQVAAANVIIQFVSYRDTGLRDAHGSPVPEAELVGQGDAWVFRGGVMVKGRWSKLSPTEVTGYTEADGSPMKLTPGRTWVELVPTGTSVQIG
jgi:hypothetical protein